MLGSRSAARTLPGKGFCLDHATQTCPLPLNDFKDQLRSTEPPQPLAESALFEFEESITSGQCPIFTRLCRFLDNAEGDSGRPSISFFSQQLPVINDLKMRSEEHTSELQSRGHLVCRLL